MSIAIRVLAKYVVRINCLPPFIPQKYLLTFGPAPFPAGAWAGAGSSGQRYVGEDGSVEEIGAGMTPNGLE